MEEDVLFQVEEWCETLPLDILYACRYIIKLQNSQNSFFCIENLHMYLEKMEIAEEI